MPRSYHRILRACWGASYPYVSRPHRRPQRPCSPAWADPAPVDRGNGHGPRSRPSRLPPPAPAAPALSPVGCSSTRLPQLRPSPCAASSKTRAPWRSSGTTCKQCSGSSSGTMSTAGICMQQCYHQRWRNQRGGCYWRTTSSRSWPTQTWCRSRTCRHGTDSLTETMGGRASPCWPRPKTMSRPRRRPLRCR